MEKKTRGRGMVVTAANLAVARVVFWLLMRQVDGAALRRLPPFCRPCHP